MTGVLGQLKDRVAAVQVTTRAVPWILLLSTVFSYGLLIPWLGFYWDDWFVVYITQTQGLEGLWDFYSNVRPFSAWNYVVFTPIFGANPIAWSVFALVLRWLSAVFLWLCLKTIWSRKADQALWIALLFSVCPIFYRQSIALTYSQHWLCFLFYFASIFCFLKAQQSKKYFYPLTLLALSLSAVQLFTLEYLAGLELLRPVWLWLYFRENEPHAPARLTVPRALKAWVAYLGVLVLYVIWRLFILRLPMANAPVIFSQFKAEPVKTVVTVVERALQDVYYLLTSWVVSVNPLNVSLFRPFSLAVLALIAFSVIAFGFMLHRHRAPDDDAGNDRGRHELLVLGLIATVLAMLPVWAIGRQVTLGADRFSFAALFGVSMVIVGAVEWLSSRRAAKIAVVTAFLALAIHTNLYVGKSFQISWERQQDFFWQVFWRAPHIQPGTAFISDGEILSNMGLYSTAMGISLLYPNTSDDPRQMSYWFFNYHEGINKIADDLRAGAPLRTSFINHTFSIPADQSLLVYFPEEPGECLQIYSPSDGPVRQVPSYFHGILPLSSLGRIQAEPLNPDWKPPETIFGPEPDPTWCYYYLKADLARQYEQWGEAVRLFDEARQRGLAPRNDGEYLIFVDSLIMSGDFDGAYDLTRQISAGTGRNNDSLCGLWSRQAELQNSPDFDKVYDNIPPELNCEN